MPTADRDAKAPWQDVQIEAAAQFSALCMQIGAGRYPWEEPGQSPAKALAERLQATPRVAMVYDLLVV